MTVAPKYVVLSDWDMIDQIRVVKYANFTAVMGCDHPSAYMMAHGDPILRNRFKTMFAIGEALRTKDHADKDSVFDATHVEIQRRRKLLIKAIAALEIPCEAIKFRLLSPRTLPAFAVSQLG